MVNAGGAARGVVGTLGGLLAQRTVAGAVGKQPVSRTGNAPVNAQCLEQPRREQGVAILAALALAHLEAHAFRGGFDVGKLQGAYFRESQAGRVGAHQQGARTHVPAVGEQAGHLFPRQYLRQTFGRLGHRDLEANELCPSTTAKRKRIAQTAWLTLA